eukprot:1824884-Rhodomonas_salina.2
MLHIHTHRQASLTRNDPRSTTRSESDDPLKCSITKYTSPPFSACEHPREWYPQRQERRRCQGERDTFVGKEDGSHAGRYVWCI